MLPEREKRRNITLTIFIIYTITTIEKKEKKITCIFWLYHRAEGKSEQDFEPARNASAMYIQPPSQKAYHYSNKVFTKHSQVEHNYLYLAHFPGFC
jgi:hypothetical protein